jgi:Pyruvate-formate lyase-activating enzyme
MPIYSWALRTYEVDKDLLRLPNVRESPFYVGLGGGRVRCTLCNRRCTLSSGQVGLCGMRFNLDGKLYTVAYGLLTAAESRPMEIKPLFHFYPRTSAMTISTWGCNFPCAWCQNWHLSKFASLDGVYVPPDRVVEWAIENGDSGVNISFNEPTLLTEYAIDLFRIARSKGLHTSINTNGYLTPEALTALREAGLEGMNSDIKGGVETYRSWLAADFKKLIDTLEYALKLGIHLEVTYLVIPGVNDDEADEVINAVAKLGRDVPLHITAYYPAHKLRNPPTPIELIDDVWRRARKELDYVYTGNVSGHPGQHTYCPRCGAVLIKRHGDRVVDVKLIGNKCPRCGYEIRIRGFVGRYGNLYRRFV